MRVFLDTNVLIGAVATRGLCADLIRNVLVSQQLVVSNALISELKRILHTKIGTPQEIITDFVEILRQDAIFSEKTQADDIEINDKDDILILSTALNGRAQLFVTGDNELLELGKVRSMRIVSPRKFWEILKTEIPNKR